MSSAFTIVNWCSGDACDPCGCSLAAAGMQHLTVAGNTLTATYGRPDSIAGQTLCDPSGRLDISSLLVPANLRLVYTYFDHTTFEGNYGDFIPQKSFTSGGGTFLQPAGAVQLGSTFGALVLAHLTVSGPGFSGSITWDWSTGLPPEIPFSISDQLVAIGDTFTISATSDVGFQLPDQDIDTTTSPFGSPYQYRYQP